MRHPRWPRGGGLFLATLLSRIAAVAALIVLVGTLPWLTGRDPALTILRAGSAERDPDPEALAAIRERLGLDDGPVALLGSWLSGLLHGDAGTSWVSGRPVLPGVVEGIGVSLTLMAGAVAVAVLLAALLSGRTLLAGSRGVVRHSSGIPAAFCTALPDFLIGSVLLVVVAVWLGWLPPYGWTDARNLVLPALAMGIPAGGLLGRLQDDALPSAFGEQWATTWHALGFRRRTLAAGGLRRALPALFPQWSLVVVALTGGAVTVETLFAIPGIGRTALGAAVAQDLPVLQVSVLALVLIGVLGGALAGLGQRLVMGPALRGGALTPVARPRPEPGLFGRLAPAGIAVLLAVVIVAGLLRDPYTVQPALRLAEPSWSLPLGADALGRDVLARLGHGALRTALLALAVTGAVLVIGLVIGFVPGLDRGLVEVVNAMPPVLSGLLTAALAGPSVHGAAIAVGAVAWAPLAAHTAALAREELSTGYVEASRCLGASPWWIYRTQVLPAVLPAVARHAMVRLPGIALALASLGFLGLGAQPPVPEWGLVLAEGMGYVERAPWAALAPAGALAALGCLTVALANLPTPAPGRRRTPRPHARPAGQAEGSDVRPAGSVQ
ncbi:ABC transporter permease subunit [Marinactinospora rubrisoli]|uniref:ABC transporter permease subunit n=1 Tax=Marinactinospora rubrisoli TaxID=2715399 RepID=A0ABW2KDS1_9ACTN